MDREQVYLTLLYLSTQYSAWNFIWIQYIFVKQITEFLNLSAFAKIQ